MTTAKISRGGAPIGVSIEGTSEFVGTFLNSNGFFKSRLSFTVPVSDFSVRLYDSLLFDDGISYVVESAELIGQNVRLSIIEA